MQILTFTLKSLAPGSTGTNLTYVTLATAAPSTSIAGLSVDPGGKSLFYQLHYAGVNFLTPSVIDVEGCVLKTTAGVIDATCNAQPSLSVALSPSTQGGDALFSGGLAWGSTGLFVASTFAQSGSAPTYNTGTIESYSVTANAGLNTAAPVTVTSVQQLNGVSGPTPILAPAYVGLAVDLYGDVATANTVPSPVASPGASPGQVDFCTAGPPYACSTLLPAVSYPVDVGFDGFGDLYALTVSPSGTASLEYCVGQSGTINPALCSSTSLGQRQATAMAVDDAGNAYIAIASPIAGILVVPPNGTPVLKAVGIKANITALAVGP